jgi:outer membrane protein OmpA-like peptidoglycan-associated protein
MVGILHYNSFSTARITFDLQGYHRQTAGIMAPMKYYQPILIFTVIFIFFAGCTTKTSSYINSITFLGKKERTPKTDNKILGEIASLIQQETNASLTTEKTAQKESEKSITLFLTDKYLKISFNIPTMFVRTDSNLNLETTNYLKEIIPVLQKYPDIIIQIIGHAYDEGTAKEMQHYADLRAISVAEFLYNSGLKQDILAKGCSDLIPRKECNLEKPHLLCSAKNRRIALFIYTSKNDLITKCR